MVPPDEISDHAPVAFPVTHKPQLPADQRPIPRFVVDHTRFPEIFNNLVDALELHKLSVPLRLKQFKELMRDASWITRDQIVASAAGSAPHEGNPLCICSVSDLAQ